MDSDEAMFPAMIFSGFVFQGGILALICVLLREHQLRWKDAFGLENGLGDLLWIVPLVAVVCYFCEFLLLEFSRFMILSMGGEPQLQFIVKLLQDSPSFEKRLFLGVSVIITAPISEELLFRGILFPALVNWLGRNSAIWINSILFSMIHGNLQVFLPLVAMGIFTSLLYEKTRNILAPIGLHSLLNLVSFIIAQIEK